MADRTFDQSYLWPEMDRLSDSFRLIYYDQRGRGRSAEGVQPEEVGIDSDVEDIESLRRWFDLDSIIVLGHSWGGVLAMEYAVRHPDHVSHLILMNTAPASHRDMQLLRDHFHDIHPTADAERMASLRATTAFIDGDLEVRRSTTASTREWPYPGPSTSSVSSVVSEPTSRAKASSRPGRSKNDSMRQTWTSPDYDLVSPLSRLDIPTLVLHGDKDFVPVELAARIADAMPRGRLMVIPECGRFGYLEFPDLVHSHITSFVQGG